MLVRMWRADDLLKGKESSRTWICRFAVKICWPPNAVLAAAIEWILDDTDEGASQAAKERKGGPCHGSIDK